MYCPSGYSVQAILRTLRIIREVSIDIIRARKISECPIRIIYIFRMTFVQSFLSFIEIIANRVSHWSDDYFSILQQVRYQGIVAVVTDQVLDQVVADVGADALIPVHVA